MVERLHGVQEVVSSNLASPTTLKIKGLSIPDREAKHGSKHLSGSIHCHPCVSALLANDGIWRGWEGWVHGGAMLIL